MKNTFNPMTYPNGMTVAELKKLLDGWPETDEYGDPCEVWVGGDNGLSSPVTSSTALNVRTNEEDNYQWSDIFLGY